MILPSDKKKVAAVSVIVKRLKGSDMDHMKSQNSEKMMMSDQEHGKDDSRSAELGYANKMMMALKQDDTEAFCEYMKMFVKMITNS